MQPVKDRYRAAAQAGARFALSVVVNYEVVRYLRLRGSTRMERDYHSLVSNWTLVELTSADWDTAADLWVARHRKGRPIEDADLLIAVTALKAGAVLVTNNTRHYADLGLTLENWMASP